MNRLIASFAIAVSLAGCGGPSTGELADRCDSLFDGIAYELEQAIRAFDEGEDPASIINLYEHAIEELANTAPQLSEDLASGGRRHSWEWPLLMRSESVVRYEHRLGPIGQTMGHPKFFLYDEEDAGNQFAFAELPESLIPLGEIGRAELMELRWFCNRAVSANLPALKDSDLEGFATRWRIKGLAGWDTEVMRAIQTDEEAEAFRDYVIRRESL